MDPCSLNHNSSSPDCLSEVQSAPSGLRYFEATIIALASFAGVFSNILNFIIIPRLPGTSQTSSLLYRGIFLGDTASSTLALLTIPGLVMGRWIYGDAVCLAFIIIWRGLLVTTSIFLLLIALDKLLHVALPLRYDQIVTPWRMFGSVAFTLVQLWTQEPIAVFLQPVQKRQNATFNPDLGMCEWERQDGFGSGDAAVYDVIQFSLVCVILLAIIAVHARIACITRRHARKIWIRQNMAPSVSAETRRTTRSTSAATCQTSFTESTSQQGGMMTLSVSKTRDNNAACSTQGATSSNLTDRSGPPQHSIPDAVASVSASVTTRVELHRPTENHVPPAPDHARRDVPRGPQSNKAIKTAVMISLAFFLAFIPVTIHYFTDNFYPKHYLVDIAIHVLYLNRVWWNALIFAYGRKAYRAEVSKLFGKDR